MTRLPRNVSGMDCVKALQKAGFYIDRQRGSHVAMVRDDPPPSVTVTVPMHRTIKVGMLRTIIRQAGMSVDEFLALL